jgi:hypothetical protein
MISVHMVCLVAGRLTRGLTVHFMQRERVTTLMATMAVVSAATVRAADAWLGTFDE